MEKLWQRCKIRRLDHVFYRGNRVKDSSENPDTGRREDGTELQRIACQDALIKYHIRSQTLFESKKRQFTRTLFRLQIVVDANLTSCHVLF
jgi:hypothetical protein